MGQRVGGLKMANKWGVRSTSVRMQKCECHFSACQPVSWELFKVHAWGIFVANNKFYLFSPINSSLLIAKQWFIFHCFPFSSDFDASKCHSLFDNTAVLQLL